MASMSISGIVSGIDWEGMITQVIENASKAANPQITKRTNLTNKKALFEEMQELTDTFRSSITTLRLSSTYEAKSIDVDRIDSTASYKGVLTAKVNADAKAGVYDVAVKQLAQTYTRRSDQITDETLLPQYAGTTLWFTQNGQRTGVTVSETDTLASLASRINTTVRTMSNPLDFTASVVDSRLILKGDYSGLGSATYTNTVSYKSGSSVTLLPDLWLNMDDLETEDFVLTDASGTEYTLGTDFDIVNGNQVRWRTADTGTVKVGDTFTAQYDAAANDVYTTQSITRGDGNKDKEVLNFTPVDTDDNNPLSGRIAITDEEGYTYAYGTDFTVDGTSILWLKSYGASRPDEGQSYTVTYTALGTETIDLSISRGDTDTFTPQSAEAVDNTFNGAAVITDNNGTVYKEGSHFNITTDDYGNMVVNWISSVAAPSVGSTYNMTLTTEDGNSVWLQGVRCDDGDPLSQTVSLTDSEGNTYVYGTDFTFDYEKDEEGTATGNISLKWNSDSTWLMPDPGTDLTLTFAFADGKTLSYDGTRSSTDTMSYEDLGFTTAGGSISSVTYGETTVTNTADNDLSINWSEEDGSVGFTWSAQKTSSHTLPADNAELTIKYKYSANVFGVDDGGSGLLAALGMDQTDETHYTAAQNALITIDGDECNLESNTLDYDNEIMPGVHMELKGLGEVSMDISNDTKTAVDAVQTFVDAYNTLMDWINTRSSEKQVNTDYSDSDSLTRSSDEFKTSWGLLYGNSYLRNTKSALRDIVSRNYTFTFTKRTSAESVYGAMSYNGITSDTTLRVAVGDRYANITIEPGDTLTTIAAKINDTSGTPSTNEAWYLQHDDKGEVQNYVKAEVVNDKLVLTKGSTAGLKDEVSLSGSTAMKALKLNYTYTGLYQIGIQTTSEDYGISGELDFDSATFSEALEANPEEVKNLMLTFSKQMETQVKSMLNASGSLTTEITNIETQISDIDEYLSNYQKRLDRMEERLRTQYAAAEERISQLSQQASSMSSLLSQIGSYTSGSSK